MTEALRAGVVGLGMMGRHHCRVLRSLPGIELVAVADAAGDPHGAASGVPLVDDVAALVELGLDLAVVAVPTDQHEEVATALAAAGVHVLVEKPLAADLPSARRLTDLFASAGLVGCVGHIERFNPAIQQLRRRLEAGELGQVYQVTARRQGPFPARISDVGVVKDLATHDIDTITYVTGEPFASVSARLAYKSGRQHEDLVTAVGALADGTAVSLSVNWLSPFKERTLVVVGERGAFVASTLTSDLEFFANGTFTTDLDSPLAHFRGVSEGDVIRYAFAKPEPLRTELEGFQAAVGGEPAGVVTMADGSVVVAVADAIVESGLTGATVDGIPRR